MNCNGCLSATDRITRDASLGRDRYGVLDTQRTRALSSINPISLVPGFGLLLLMLLCSAILQAQDDVAFTAFHYVGTDLWADAHPLKANEFLNPILAGMYPDPSVVRVGSDFYLVNSTFAWYPGIPIFHSRDLVHWHQIGFALNRPSQLDLDHLQVSEGIFAPTIRYHHGVFYIITTLVGGLRTFYVTARDPAGPWSDPISLPEIAGIDPSFFFDDDGEAYIVHNAPPPDSPPLYSEQRAIWLVPFDVKTGKISGKRRMLVNGGINLASRPRWIEGPHLFRRNGYYYLIAAEGGTSTDHSEVVFRSVSLDAPFIPYPGNPILTQRMLVQDRTDAIADTGHADMVEAPDGTWWAVFLGVRPYAHGFFNTGRETYLLPVTWKNEWPVILTPGDEVPRVLERPALKQQEESKNKLHGSFTWDDDFKEKSLKPEWQTLRTPSQPCWALNSEARQVVMHPDHDDLTSRDHPCFLGRRQQHADFTATIDLSLRDNGRASDAGLAVFQNEHSFFFLGVTPCSLTTPEIFVEQGIGTMSSPSGIILAQKRLPAGGEKIELRITEAGPKISFSYHLAGKGWTQLGGDADATLLSTSKAGGFVGSFIGPFARLKTKDCADPIKK